MDMSKAPVNELARACAHSADTMEWAEFLGRCAPVAAVVAARVARITDVRMAGVSMLRTKRSEFNSYILHNGGAVEPLVEELEVRVAGQ